MMATVRHITSKVGRTKCSLIFAEQCTYVFMYSTRYSCQTLIIREFSIQFYKKIPKYKISRKSVQWE